MITNQPNRVLKLLNNTYVVQTKLGDILVNSPPETLKYLRSEGISIPKFVLLPPDIPVGQQLGSSGFVYLGINYASVEFLLYANYFFNGEDQTCIITVTEDQKQRLEQILQETIAGPAENAEYFPHPWVKRECAAMSFYPPLGRVTQSDDLAKIRSLEMDGGNLGEQVEIVLQGQEYIFFEDGVEIARVSTLIDEIPMPLMLAPPHPIQRQEITLQFIGGSDGFDPEGITTCFLAYFGATGEDTATLFDAAAYLRMRLGNLGIAPNQISEVFISHLHEDHIAGLPELLLMGGCRIRVITSETIYRSLLRVLSAMLALPQEDIAVLFDFSPLEPDYPLQIDGKRFEAVYAIHTIPTLAVRVNGLCYSGDMRYDEYWFEDLEKQGILSATRKQQLLEFAQGASILVQDAGGGTIHTAVTSEVLDSLANKSQHIILTHAPKQAQQLPDSHKSWKNIVFAEHGMVTSVGQAIAPTGQAEKLETISACPLYSRLSIAERNSLAQKATITEWKTGETILELGDRCDGAVYIVHTGLAEVWDGSKRVQVAGRGTSIGERCALMGNTYSLAVIAHGPVKLLRLESEIFQAIAKRLGLQSAIERAERLWDHPIFHRLPWVMLLDLALDFQPWHLPTGRLLFEYGKMGHECYMLISGAVTIFDKDLNPLGILNEDGEFFGARSVLFNQPRNAYACVSADAEIWVLPASALMRLQFVYPGVILHLRAVELSRQGMPPLVSALNLVP
ncbi:MAG TPA: cyclic nucleotide-binding protein [Chloroflexi bacterium]|nr:cyclic nucleotide-binding protein [Chloroflexota bacterium]HBY09501.1 cyclic nucleotide-binding protein [Chloroflexota bacterium]